MSKIAQSASDELQNPSNTGTSHRSSISVSVIIATRNRVEPLKRCLLSLDKQTMPVIETIVVDSSDGDDTERLLASLKEHVRFSLSYLRSSIRSAAVQRNQGADVACGTHVLFLDDDVVLESNFVAELMKAFDTPDFPNVGGASGTIVNQTFVEPRGLNRFLLGFALGRWSGSYSGRLLGPAVNFLPRAIDGIQPVEWLPSCCAAFPKSVFLRYRFGSTFQGYSFAEDVHLSARIGQSFQLINMGKAKLFHEDLGGATHRDWVALGHSIVMNRHLIMSTVMGKRGLANLLRLFYYEMVYSPLAFLNAGVGRRRLQIAMDMLRGRAAAFRDLIACKSPHLAR
ncbi:MAG: glycosyltransferase [Bryobacteraceae bacterium]